MRALFVLTVASLALANPAFGQGIKPLTEESYKQALAPNGAVGCESGDPLDLVVKMWDKKAAADHYKELTGPGRYVPSEDAAMSAWVKLVQDQFPYSIVIHSPYCQLAMQADTAARSYKPFSSPTFDASTVQTILISVSAGSSFAAAADIKHMVVLRDGAPIQPLKAELHPVKIQNRAGASREVVAGDFTFPIEAFALGGKVTLVWIGPSHNWEFTLTPAELGKLK